MIKALRTPDERFTNLPGYAFEPHYLDKLSGYEGLRLHYLDEGPRSAAKVYLCLHGNPAWSYLYRKMIPPFLSDGGRVVAPDLFGFGRSDKPIDPSSYGFKFHRSTLLRFIEALDLRNVTLVCQDWGGILGLTLPMDMPERFDRLLVMNTTLATGDEPLSEGFLAWRDWCRHQPDMAVGKLFRRSHKSLSEEEARAYDAPFPDLSYKAGILSFPRLVCDNPDAPGAALSRAARQWWRKQWSGASFMAVGMQDPVFGLPVMENLSRSIRNCPVPFQVPDGGHFVQECGDVIAHAALAHWNGHAA